jgi:hypothetical protein
MFKFKVLVQNRPQARYYYRNGYIRATTLQEAVSNLNTVFHSFNHSIISLGE